MKTGFQVLKKPCMIQFNFVKTTDVFCSMVLLFLTKQSFHQLPGHTILQVLYIPMAGE